MEFRIYLIIYPLKKYLKIYIRKKYPILFKTASLVLIHLKRVWKTKSTRAAKYQVKARWKVEVGRVKVSSDSKFRFT